MDHLKELARSCASSIYGHRAPTVQYARAVGDLLIGTAAVESGMTARRQYGYETSDSGGAWGKWQTEAPPLVDNIRYLRAHDAVRRNAGRWLYGPCGDEDMGGLLRTSEHCLLRLIHDWDRLAVLMARIHYMRFSAPVPSTLQGQAEYWKRYYNTTAGKGTPGKYIRAWERLVA